MSDRAAWTGDIVSLLHVNKITQNELSEELGVTHNYVSMILNGKSESAGMEERMRDAIARIVSRKDDKK